MKWYNFTTFTSFWKQIPGEEGVARSLREAYAAYKPDKPGTIPEGFDPNRVDNVPQPPPPEPIS